MAYDVEKLKAFAAAIRQETEDEIAALQQEEKRFEVNEIAKAKQEEELRAARLKEEDLQKIRLHYQKEITRERMNERRRLLEERNRLLEAVFDETKQKLAAFTASEDYLPYLVEKLQESMASFPANEAVLCVPRALLTVSCEAAKQVAGITAVEESAALSLGGFCLSNLEAGFLLDESFETLLDEQRQAFLAKSGLKVDF